MIFQVGDRVMCTRDCGPVKSGTVGTVLSHSRNEPEVLLVEWDTLTTHIFSDGVWPKAEAGAVLYCIKDFEPGARLTKGKTYTVKDGTICYDDGYEAPWTGANTLRLVPVVPNYLVYVVERPAQKGEWIKITEARDERVDTGEVYQFVETVGSCVHIKHPQGLGVSGGVTNIHDSEYVVLVGYKPELEFYTGKVVCVESVNACFTAGKVYAVENGQLMVDGGSVGKAEVRDIEELNAWYVGVKFIEFRGE